MTSSSIATSVHELLTDELSRLEWRVARRADQLAADFGPGREMDRERWLLAEREEWRAHARELDPQQLA